MSLLEVGGVAVVAGSITLPRVGRWVADLELEGPGPGLGNKATLRGPGLALAGHVARVGSFVGEHRVRLCAGAGGLLQPLPPASFCNMPLSLLLADVLGAVGERLSPLIDADLLSRTLPSWVRPAGTAAAALTTLAELLGVLWRILPDGTVWLGTDTWRAAPVSGELLDPDPLSRTVHVALDTMAIFPGSSWNGVRVEVVTHDISGTGFRTTLSTP